MKKVVVFSCLALLSFPFMNFTLPVNLSTLKTYQAGWVGGNGGNYFENIMPNGATISSIDTYHGKVIDGITIHYHDNYGSKGSFHLGGWGGSRHTHHVDQGVVLVGISGRSGSLVDSIQFHFSDGSNSPTYGGGGGSPYNIDIPDTAIAAGFYGRSGRVIDKIGLLYRQ